MPIARVLPSRPRAAALCALLLASLLALAALPRAAAAQDTGGVLVSETVLQVLRLRDGTVLRGYVLAADTAVLSVATADGRQVQVPRDQVVSVAPEGDDEAAAPRDPMRHRLFVGPTARALPAGEGYVGLVDAVLPTAAFGITDRIGVEAGTILLPEVALEAFFLATKAEVVRLPGLSLAAGGIAFFATESVGEGSVGAVYGVGTAGNEEGSVSLAALWPFVAAEGDDAFADQPFFMLGGDLALGASTRLLAESYVVPGEDEAPVSAGFRFLGRRVSADVGVGVLYDGGTVECCLPLVTVVYAFGGGR